MKQVASEQRCAPRVSVIMPAYNAAAYIRQAIRSVQRQSVEDWELLVVDDASRDETKQLVREMARQDGRIKLLENSGNRGTAWCRNRGIQASTGQVIAFLDSDDLWDPAKLEQQLVLMAREKADLVYCAYRYIDESGEEIGHPVHVPERMDMEQMLRNNRIGCSTVMLTREALARFGFSERFYFEDYVLWLSLLQAGKRLRGLDTVLVDYRIRKNSRGNNKLLCAKHRWAVYREYMGFSRRKSLYYQARYAMTGVLKYMCLSNRQKGREKSWKRFM